MIRCNVCGREFSSMAGLAGHYKVHTQNQANLQQTLVVEALDRQNRLLEKIIEELESIHRLLENLNIVEARVEKTVTARTITASSQKFGEKREESSLPSYLRDNPWVEILQGRVLEEDKK
jgi:hypothetical protein